MIPNLSYPPLNFDRWQAIATELSADVITCRDHLARIAETEIRIDQFWARGFVRAFFAYVESSVFEMRLIIKDAAEGGRITLSTAERSLIDEESYELGESGKAETRSRYLKIDRNFRFTTALFARVFGAKVNIEYGGAGWPAFRGAIKIRNRITHPRDRSDIEISVEELVPLASAFAWYVATTEALLTESIAAMKVETSKLEAATHRLRHANGSIES